MKKKIGIVGLGYVGLPLALEFSKFFQVIGYDKDKKRVNELKKNFDKNSDLTSDQLKKANIFFSNNLKNIKNCNIFIITLPTPINKNYNPDLSMIINATKDISKYIKRNDIIIYESTFFPGTVENICVPIIEKNTKLKYNLDFYCGYSPERINPGDKKNKLTSIKKITSGSNQKISQFIDKLYKKIIKKGTFKAKSIQVAEAAKIIENVQRDINIALMNELYFLFKKSGINFYDVLSAASTKWNFLKFYPGLVGGHCIGVDPYYLQYYSKKHNFNTRIISSGRSINNSVHKNLVKLLLNKFKSDENFKKMKIIIFGFSFKENCTDVRNTKVFDFYNNLKSHNSNIDIYDPVANNIEAKKLYNIKILDKLKNNKKYDLIIVLVPHKIFKQKIQIINRISTKNSLIFDYKNIFKVKDKRFFNF